LILGVGGVPRLRLTVDTSRFARSVVYRRCDRPIVSSVVHLLLIGLVGFMVLVGSKLYLCSLLSYRPVIDSRRHYLPMLEVETP
jgi:hypothetical protein